MTKHGVVTYSAVLRLAVAGALVGKELEAASGCTSPRVAVQRAMPVLGGMAFAGYEGEVVVEAVKKRGVYDRVFGDCNEVLGVVSRFRFQFKDGQYTQLGGVADGG